MTNQWEPFPHHSPPHVRIEEGNGLLTFLSSIKERWRAGIPADAHAILSDHPEWENDKSLVLDLAYEEYCLRREAGENLDPGDFCGRFPRFQTSLRHLLEAHQLLEDNPQLLGPTQAPSWPQPGETFLGFSLQRELGRGAFARVFLATEPAMGHRRVVVKIALHGAAEAATLGPLNHPNIVPVFSVHTEEHSGLTVVCMPYRGAATLCDILDALAASPARPCSARIIFDTISQIETIAETPTERQPSNPPPWLQGTYIDGVCHLGEQLAGALAFIHDLGICHRDLKPSNVLMSQEGRPLLLDFNLSANAEQRGNQRLGGTLPYMAPEQLRAMQSEDSSGSEVLDGRSDLFALGVILYELLTGKHPFGPILHHVPPQQFRLQLLERQKRGVAPIRSLNAQLDPALAAVLESCLAFDPAQRPPTAARLAALLRQGLSRRRRLRRWLAAHLHLTLAILCLGLMLATAASMKLLLRPPYSQRQLEVAWSVYRQQQYTEAVDYLDRALAADASLTEAYFLRGRCHQRLRALTLAINDYLTVLQHQDDGKTFACLGYCYGRLPKHRDAIRYHWAAIQARFDPAAVYNNLSYSQMRLGKLNEAEANLAKAIQKDPHLQSAYHNRLILARIRLLEKKVPLSMLDVAKDLDQAFQRKPVSVKLYNDAACLCALVALQDHSWSDRALDYLRQALAAGQDPKSLQSDWSFSKLSERDARIRDELARALAHQPRPTAATSEPPLVDPLDDDN